MTLQALAERLRGHLPSSLLGSTTPQSPASSPSPSPAAAAAARAGLSPPPPQPLPATWMAQLRCAPRLMGVAIMRNSMGASLALLTGVLIIDAAMGPPPRRKLKTARTPQTAAAPLPLVSPPPPLA